MEEITMADYKEMLTGAIKNIAGIVKDAAEATGVKEVYEQGIERTKSYGTIAKLTVEINNDEEELKKVYQEIGRLYYEDHKDDPEGFYASLFSQVDALTASVNEKREEIETLKSSIEASGKSDIDVEIGEFDDVVDSTEADGTGKDE